MGNPKKILNINLFFHLSDDFEGSIDDAVKQWLDHRKAISSADPIPEENSEFEDIGIYDNEMIDLRVMFSRFIDTVHDGYRSLGTVSISSLNEDKNMYE